MGPKRRLMTRLSIILLSALIAAAPLSAANAQDRGGRGDRGDRSSPAQDRCPAPSMGDSQAASIARSQVPPGAELKATSQSCGVYTVTFEHNGRIIRIQVDGRR